MRKITTLRLAAAELAARFEGLPPNYSRFDLCDDLSAARRRLSLDGDGLWLLQFLIKRTSPEDWERGAEPIIAWSRFHICCQVGWSEDKLLRVESRLCDLQLIAFRDAPNCKRRAYRNADGAMDANSKGISLGPVGARAREIIAAAEECKSEANKLFQAFGRLFDLKAEISRYAGAEGVPPQAAAATADLIKALPERRSHKAALADLYPLIERASAMLKALKALVHIPAATEAPEAGESPAADTAAQPCLQRSSAPTYPDHQRTSPRTSPICSAPIRPLHRRFAGHNKSESINLEKEQDLLGIVAAAPEVFRAYLDLEHTRSGGRPWETVLQTAVERFGHDLSLRPSLIARVRADRGLGIMLKALFGLAVKIERGFEIANPAGYFVALATNAEKRPMRHAALW